MLVGHIFRLCICVRVCVIIVKVMWREMKWNKIENRVDNFYANFLFCIYFFYLALPFSIFILFRLAYFEFVLWTHTNTSIIHALQTDIIALNIGDSCCFSSSFLFCYIKMLIFNQNRNETFYLFVRNIWLWLFLRFIRLLLMTLTRFW